MRERKIGEVRIAVVKIEKHKLHLKFPHVQYCSWFKKIPEVLSKYKKQVKYWATTYFCCMSCEAGSCDQGLIIRIFMCIIAFKIQELGYTLSQII